MNSSGTILRVVFSSEASSDQKSHAPVASGIALRDIMHWEVSYQLCPWQCLSIAFHQEASTLADVAIDQVLAPFTMHSINLQATTIIVDLWESCGNVTLVRHEGETGVSVLSQPYRHVSNTIHVSPDIHNHRGSRRLHSSKSGKPQLCGLTNWKPKWSWFQQHLVSSVF